MRAFAEHLMTKCRDFMQLVDNERIGLIIDQYSPHDGPVAGQKLLEDNIDIMYVPSNASHFLQVGVHMNGVLQKAKREVFKKIAAHGGAVTKSNVLRALKPALAAADDSDNILTDNILTAWQQTIGLKYELDEGDYDVCKYVVMNKEVVLAATPQHEKVYSMNTEYNELGR